MSEPMGTPAGIIHLTDRVKVRDEHGESKTGYVIGFIHDDLVPQVRVRYLDKSAQWVFLSFLVYIVIYTDL